MNRHAASAQIESEDVDAVSVFITGDKDSSARNANIDDLTAFASIDGRSRLSTKEGGGGPHGDVRFVGFRTWRNLLPVVHQRPKRCVTTGV